MKRCREEQKLESPKRVNGLSVMRGMGVVRNALLLSALVRIAIDRLVFQTGANLLSNPLTRGSLAIAPNVIIVGTVRLKSQRDVRVAVPIAGSHRILFWIVKDAGICGNPARAHGL